MKPNKRLIRETKALINLSLFLRQEVGLKEGLSVKELKQLLFALKLDKRKKKIKICCKKEYNINKRRGRFLKNET